MSRTRRDYGPVQLGDRLGLQRFHLDRAIAQGQIPAPDRAGGRWSAAVVETAVAWAGQIRAAVGLVPDLGAARAAELLTERFGIPVPADVLVELDRHGLVPQVGTYRGYALYDGQALESFTDRTALQRALVAGRLCTAEQVAEDLRVRRSDVEHLIRAGWLEPVTHVHSRWQPRRRRPRVARTGPETSMSWPTIPPSTGTPSGPPRPGGPPRWPRLNALRGAER